MTTEIKTRTLMAKLVNVIDPTAKYPVNYTINQRGEKKEEIAIINGSDLTENQIFELWKEGYITTKK